MSEDKINVSKRQNSQKAVGLRASKMKSCKVLERASHHLSGLNYQSISNKSRAASNLKGIGAAVEQVEAQKENMTTNDYLLLV